MTTWHFRGILGRDEGQSAPEIEIKFSDGVPGHCH